MLNTLKLSFLQFVLLFPVYAIAQGTPVNRPSNTPSTKWVCMVSTSDPVKENQLRLEMNDLFIDAEQVSPQTWRLLFLGGDDPSALPKVLNAARGFAAGGQVHSCNRSAEYLDVRSAYGNRHE